MNLAHFIFRSASTVLFTAVALLSLAETARADEPTARYQNLALERLLPGTEADDRLPAPRLPLDLMDESDLREAHQIDFTDFLPQGRMAQQPPFIDFSKFEMGGFVGIVDYGSNFEAKASYAFGITSRVPIPGLPLGEWGVWGEVLIAYIDRDLPFYYKDKAGNWFGLALGADYTFLRQPTWFLRGQLGLLYANWNGVNSLDDGIGIMAGVQFAWYWIQGNDKASLNITPQFSYDGTDWIGLITVGFSVDF